MALFPTPIWGVGSDPLPESTAEAMEAERPGSTLGGPLPRHTVPVRSPVLAGIGDDEALEPSGLLEAIPATQEPPGAAIAGGEGQDTTVGQGGILDGFQPYGGLTGRQQLGLMLMAATQGASQIERGDPVDIRNVMQRQQALQTQGRKLHQRDQVLRRADKLEAEGKTAEAEMLRKHVMAPELVATELQMQKLATERAKQQRITQARDAATAMLSGMTPVGEDPAGNTVATATDDQGNVITRRYTPDELQQVRLAVQGDDPTAAAKVKADIDRLKITREDKFRTDWEKTADFYSKIRRMKDDALEVVNSPDSEVSGVEKLRTLYQYITALDPNSVVREGEIALAASAAPVFARFIGTFEKLDSGGNVPASTIKAMAAEIVKMADKADAAMLSTADMYRTLATYNALDSRNILGTVQLPQAAQAAAPAPAQTTTRQGRPPGVVSVTEAGG